MHPQDATQGGDASEALGALQSLGWIDTTALGVLLVFFVLGLFKGLIWQVSRIGILVAAYLASGRYGGALAEWLARPEVPDVVPANPPATTIYLAYCLLFLAVLVVLSLLAIVVQKLAVKAGLGFYDRMGGGLLGVATGGCVVLFVVFFVHMFFRGSQLATAVQQSHASRLSRLVVDGLGARVPKELRQVFELPPLPGAEPATAEPGDGIPVEASHGRGDPDDEPEQPGAVAPPQRPVGGG